MTNAQPGKMASPTTIQDEWQAVDIKDSSITHNQSQSTNKKGLKDTSMEELMDEVPDRARLERVVQSIWELVDSLSPAASSSGLPLTRSPSQTLWTGPWPYASNIPASKLVAQESSTQTCARTSEWTSEANQTSAPTPEWTSKQTQAVTAAPKTTPEQTQTSLPAAASTPEQTQATLPPPSTYQPPTPEARHADSPPEGPGCISVTVLVLIFVFVAVFFTVMALRL
jgi:hypothetical protein